MCVWHASKIVKCQYCECGIYHMPIVLWMSCLDEGRAMVACIITVSDVPWCCVIWYHTIPKHDAISMIWVCHGDMDTPYTIESESEMKQMLSWCCQSFNVPCTRAIIFNIIIIMCVYDRYQEFCTCLYFIFRKVDREVLWEGVPTTVQTNIYNNNIIVGIIIFHRSLRVEYFFSTYVAYNTLFLWLSSCRNFCIITQLLPWYFLSVVILYH